MATFILVHGTFATTFAKHAGWTLEGSPLRIRLENEAARAGQSADFKCLSWSGWNWYTSRVNSARSISVEVRKLSESQPREPIFLIGHSHGGSAIAYFLKSYPELSNRISGVAFLSTPFVAFRLRPSWLTFLSALMLWLGIFAGALAFVLLNLFLILASPRIPSMFTPQVAQVIGMTAAPIMIVLGTIVSVLFGRFAMNTAMARLQVSLSERLGERLKTFATTDLSPGNQLFLHATGDEAAGVLAAAQLFSWMTARLVALASGILIGMYQCWKWLRARFWGPFLGLLLVVIFGLCLSERIGVGYLECYKHHSCIFSWEHFFSTDLHLTLYDGNVAKYQALVFGFFLKYFWPAFIVFFVFLVLYFWIVVVAVAFGWLAFAFFGWFGIVEPLFADISVEKVPFGSTQVIHVAWDDPAAAFASPSGLNHSATYRNGKALECLGAWVTASLGPTSALNRATA